MSSNSDLLTQNEWRALGQRFRVRDNGLQRALGAYEALDEEQFDERLRGIASITQLANALKRTREVAAVREVVTALTDLIAAATAEQRDITRQRAQAQKHEAASRQSEQASAAADEESEEEDEAEENYAARLVAAYEKLKRSRGLSFQFIVCEARPFCGLMIAKRITPQHRAELTRLTGGRRFLPMGTCSVESGVLNFVMDRPERGLARKLQLSLHQFTGRRIRVTVGEESAGDEEDEGSHPAAAPESGQIEPEESGAQASTGRTGNRRRAGSPGPEASPASDDDTRTREPEATPGQRGPNARRTLPRATLARAPQVWHGTRGIVDRRIQALKQAVRAEDANDEPDLIREIDQKLGRLDDVLDRLDHRLADALANANDAASPSARTAQLRNARTILTHYISFVRTEPLIAQIDQNPFGVNTGLRRLLTDSLTHMAQAIAAAGTVRTRVTP